MSTESRRNIRKPADRQMSLRVNASYTGGQPQRRRLCPSRLNLPTQSYTNLRARTTAQSPHEIYRAVATSAPELLCHSFSTLNRRGLRSSCSDCLVQPPVHRSTVGSRAFSVAGVQVWNCLPPEVTSASFLTTFHTRLKTFLFNESYPDIRLI